ncbi:hypothetical protein PRIPAC_90497 [Pristionchus pacificus]|uniref:Uncharacterized protein n=1 Tax=Pristionchus pacificus TaxID=54126 RepID=A0A2A6B417_PRIPA|nr:hypothetical protein PRIPAC_90497 [Pristionchus pacificus]|eukprot:PDM60622.1 hypothetical protein PRIPAC_52084 [Pristionchus pacificus]
MLSRSHSPQCTACLSPYRHRNLHTDTSSEQRLSPFETECLPRLWRETLLKNPLFCEHVVHSWMGRLARRRALHKTTTNKLPDSASTSTQFVSREGERLLFFLNNLVEGVEQKEQVFDKRDQLISFAASQGWLSGWGPRWWGRRKEAMAALNLLSESLIEQFIVQLDMEDVHERELFLIVWKHFVLSLVTSLQAVLRKRSRSCLSLSTESSLSESTSETSSQA